MRHAQKHRDDISQAAYRFERAQMHAVYKFHKNDVAEQVATFQRLLGAF
jgi:hypothetical protein